MLLILLLAVIIIVIGAIVAASALSARHYTGSGSRGSRGSPSLAHVTLPARLFHGSKHPVGAAGGGTAHVLEPRPSRVIGGESAVFATNARWLALAFISGARGSDIELGTVDDDGKPLSYILEARPGTFDLLKVPGYIYSVSSRGFKSDPRLGMKRHEFIKSSAAKIVHVEHIASAWDELQKCDITLVPYADSVAFNAKYDIPTD